jgi:Rrf2 family protein
MQITKQADYAVRAVLELARSNGSTGRLTAEEIAQRRGIPHAFLSKTLGLLADAGLVETRRGVKGGVALRRPPQQISLLDVVEAIDGPLDLCACVLAPADCRWTETCPVHPIWLDMRHEMRTRLAAARLDMLVIQEKRARSRRVPAQTVSS